MAPDEDRSDEREEGRAEDDGPSADDVLASGAATGEAPPISPAGRRFKTLFALILMAVIIGFLLMFILTSSDGAGGGTLGTSTHSHPDGSGFLIG